MCNPVTLTAFQMASSVVANANALTAKPPKPPAPPVAAQPPGARKGAAPTGGYSSTLLTGPRGVTGGQNVGTNTLLGQ